MFGHSPLWSTQRKSPLKIADRLARFLMHFLSLTLWLPGSWDAIQDERGYLQLLLASCCGEGRDCISSCSLGASKVIVFLCSMQWSEGYVKSSSFPQTCCWEKEWMCIVPWGTSAWLFFWGKVVLWIKHVTFPFLESKKEMTCCFKVFL